MYDNNLFNVDTTGVEKMGGYEVYPAGLYPAIMVTAQKKPTSNNNGAFIECVYQFIDGPHSGKKFTSRMNLWNQNQQAVDIAKRELKSLRSATGNSDVESDLAKFVNRPVVLNIDAKARKDDPTKIENVLRNIETYGGQPAAPAAQPQAPMFAAPQQQPPANAGWAPQPAAQPQPTFAAPNTNPSFQPQAGGTAPWMQGAR